MQTRHFGTPTALRCILLLLVPAQASFAAFPKPVIRSCPDAEAIRLLSNSEKVPLIQVDIDGTQAVFGVDTGADISLIAETFADKAGLARTAKEVILNGKRLDTSLAAYETMRIGELSVTCAGVLAHDMRRVNAHMDVKMDGVLGMDLLKQLCFELNSQSGTLTFYRDSLIQQRTKHCIPAEFLGNRIKLTAVLNAQRVDDFYMDTGAQETIIRTNALARLNVDAPRIQSAKGRSIGVVGAAPPAKAVALDRFVIGPHTLSPFSVRCDDVHRRNIVGMSVLSQFRVRVDPFSKLVELVPTADADTKPGVREPAPAPGIPEEAISRLQGRVAAHSQGEGTTGK